MGSRENKIETYLREQVQLIGGDTRKWVSPGRVGVPDELVLVQGDLTFVETKTPDGKLDSWQVREHNRLIDLGFRVEVLWSKPQVDRFIFTLKQRLGLITVHY